MKRNKPASTSSPVDAADIALSHSGIGAECFRAMAGVRNATTAEAARHESPKVKGRNQGRLGTFIMLGHKCGANSLRDQHKRCGKGDDAPTDS